MKLFRDWHAHESQSYATLFVAYKELECGIYSWSDAVFSDFM